MTLFLVYYFYDDVIIYRSIVTTKEDGSNTLGIRIDYSSLELATVMGKRILL